MSWGADRTTLLRLHTSLVPPTLDYGCHVYSSASSSLLHLLDPVHHLGLRLALGAFRSSPVESLYAESGLPSLSRRRALLSLRSYARSHQLSTSSFTIPPSLSAIFSSHPRLPSLLPVRMQALLSHPSSPTLKPLPFYVHSFPPWLQPTPLICKSVYPTSPKADTSPSFLRNLFLEHLPTHATSTHIYTDGSKSPLGSAFATLFPDSHLQYRLPPEASVLTTELYAILYALKSLLRSPSSSFTIFTDSQNSLSLLTSMSPHPLVCEIQDWLFRLAARHKKIHFCWVPSHVGIPGNARVDALAREASTIQCPRLNSLPVSDYFPAFKNFLYTRWQSYWSGLTFNKLRTIKPSITPWSFPNHHNRCWETALARLRIGHTRLTHGHLMSQSPPPYCLSCKVNNTLSHILLSCLIYTHFCHSVFPHLAVSCQPPSLVDILSKSPSFSLSNLMSFLHNINVLHLI